MMVSKRECIRNAVAVVILLMSTFQCGVEAVGPGEIYPTTAELVVGGSVNITCRMNPYIFPGRNSSDLRFFNAHTNETIRNEDVVIANTTSIIYTLRNAVEQSTTLLCKCGQDAIMYMKLYVGRLPSNVYGFRCRNYDYEYMVCNFTQPKNHVLTQYNLTYYLHSLTYTYNMHCNYDAKPLVICNTTLSDVSRHLEYFTINFILRAGNALGNHSQLFNFNAIDIAVPKTVGYDLHEENVSTDSLEIKWKMFNYDLYRKRGLQWHVVVQPYKQAPIDFSANAVIERRGHSELQMHLTGLPHAYYNYTVHVRARVQMLSASTISSSIDLLSDGFSDDINNEAMTNATLVSDDLWSVPFVFSFRSAARLPDRPPRTDVGSFYIYSNEMQVRIYWQQLQPYEYNGDQFHYVINVFENGYNITLLPNQLELNSATFDWRKDLDYRYEIRSCNHIGKSKEFSVIEIPKQTERNQRNHTPPAVHSVYHAMNNTYTLTWVSPVENTHLQNYTIFWCDSKPALQTECQGFINFKHVDRNMCNFTTPAQEHMFNFAVSANYDDYNTGMHWTPCTTDVNSDLVKMEPEAQATSATTILIQWIFQRICLSVISGYKIIYCEFDKDNSKCLPNSEVTYDFDKNLKKYTLSGLRPYTVYQVQMLMYSIKKQSKLSEPLIVQTQEWAPSPPRQLQQKLVTRNSATITWQPPINANGLLRYYIIKYNDHHIQYNLTQEIIELNEPLEYELRNLTSYSDYRVLVYAHTIADSVPSNELQLHTLIGAPSMPGEFLDDDSSIAWGRPIVPAGRLEYYELAVTEYNEDQMVRCRISTIIGATSCRLSKPNCIDQKQRYVFKVRAINAALLTHEVAEDDNYSIHDLPEPFEYYNNNDDLECIGGYEHDAILKKYNNPEFYRLYHSEWRGGNLFGCSKNSFDIMIIYILICSFLMAFFVMALTYVAHKKIITMWRISCTLPPGLATYFIKDGVAGMIQTEIGVDRNYGNVYAVGHHQQQNGQNEKHHLLSAVGNDSGYLGGDNHTMEQHVSTPRSHSGCMRTISESSSADSMIESNDSSSSMGHELDELNIDRPNTTLAIAANGFHNTLPRITEEYVPNVISTTNTNMSMATSSSNNGTGYVNPMKILNWKEKPEMQSLTPVQQQRPQPFNDYVSVNQLSNPSAPVPSSYGVNGYVQPSHLPRLFSATANINPITPERISAILPSAVSPVPTSGEYTTLAKLQQHQQSPIAISNNVTYHELNQLNQQECN